MNVIFIDIILYELNTDHVLAGYIQKVWMQNPDQTAVAAGACTSM